MKHIHHDMIIEWAKDTSRILEVRNSDRNWVEIQEPGWVPTCVYRFKPAEPKYIVVNGVNVPEPVRGELNQSQEYWVAWATAEGTKPARLFWGHTCEELRWLSLGLVHLTCEAAQAHIDAMLLPSRSDK